MPDPVPMPCPAPDDLQGWKQFDTALSRRCGEPRWFGRVLASPRAVRRYFGHDDLDAALESHAHQGVLPAYASWGILSCRSTATSPTRAEFMLKQGLSEAEAVLLRVRMEAVPGIYRVADCDPEAGTVTLDAVLDNGLFTVHDKLLSGCVTQNLFLICRIFRAGNFWLLEMAGPPLGALQVSDAIAFLRSLNMDFTHEGRLRDAHLFGRLWEWCARAADRPSPRVCNMDGDEMLWHTASFSLADPEQTRQTILRRDDIETGDDGIHRWMAYSGPAAQKMGGPVSLAHIEFVGDELVLTVNSARRFAKARKWIERTPGVTFAGVTTRAFDEPKTQWPLDERISKPESVEMTPQLSSAIADLLNKHYLAWLDKPLPVLGGKTPREAARTPAGREQVTVLIRTIPDPVGPAQVRVPREHLLRELGIDCLAPTTGGAEPPLAACQSSALPYGNVSRNEPCPCGSGRKYKNCCGR